MFLAQPGIVGITKDKMVEGKKFIVGLCGLVVLLLLGGLYKVTISDDRIVVSLPSDFCDAATLRVTKDDFTLKCGNRIAFQADIIVEYWRTYGQNEKGEEAWWVRNNRFVGFNKKHITLSLTDYGNYFDVTQRTRYRKGRQNIDDGILETKFTFTKDKVKISFDYEVNNKALHRISMRIKKQVGSYLDAFDINGHTGILSNDILSYQGYGDLLIDPTVTLESPASLITTYVEGDIVPFVGWCNQTNESKLTSMNFWWNAVNESIWHLNESTTITANTTATYTKTIPHPVTSTFQGIFVWNIECCNNTQTSGVNCTFSTNRTVDARYKPEVPTIHSPNSIHLNLLNGSGLDWNMVSFYSAYMNISDNQSILINWTHPGIRDNGTGIIWNLSYYGSSNSTRIYDTNFAYSGTGNASRSALFNTSNLRADVYYVTLRACNALNETLCESDTLDIPIDIFDYTISISTGETEIRFSPYPTYTKRAALGQTPSRGIIAVDWLGYRFPDGKINLSINHTESNNCMDMYAYSSNEVSSSVQIHNNTYVTVLNTTDADPDYIWLWATKAGCTTTTTGFTINSDLFFGGS